MSKVNVRHLSVLVLLCFIMALVPPIPVFADEVTPLNVRDYGAVGDGQTDDRAAIQAAIDAATTGAGGGVVQFPAGTYLVEEIVVLKSNITLTLDQNATILNGINQASHPSIIFMTGPFTEDGEQVFWGSTQNITITGGTIDMNGELNTSGSAAKNLPNIGSSGAFALGYSSNVTIENVTFGDSYKGHAIQICACNGVTIKNCSFLGQALPNFLTDSQKINLETVQIEPSTTKGFPYALNATGAPSQNITIEDCYFGASTKTGEPVVAIGTHNQVVSAQKCHHINILDNEFDNMMYAGIRFCGYEDVTIQGNVFTKKTAAQSIHYRENGCFLINAYCYNNTTDSLDLNRRITINNNTFNIADPNTRGIRVAKDKDTYLGTVRADGFLCSIDEALTAREWDFITLQQASPLSYRIDSYEPYLNRLAEHIRYMCPKAKLLIHQTWAYETGSERIRTCGFETYDEMFAQVKYCYEKAASAICADGIIPSGEVFQQALQAGISSLHRDTFHANCGVGRFILALVWYVYLTKKSVVVAKFDSFTEYVDEREYYIAVELARMLLSSTHPTE